MPHLGDAFLRTCGSDSSSERYLAFPSSTDFWYNVVCAVTSVISVIATPVLLLLLSHRRQQQDDLRIHIVNMLLLTDTLACSGLLLRSITELIVCEPPKGMPRSTLGASYYDITTVYLQYVHTCSNLWTLCYAVSILISFSRKQSGKWGADSGKNENSTSLCGCSKYMWFLNALIWGVAALVYSCQLAVGISSGIPASAFISFGLMMTVVVVNPCVYGAAALKVKEIVKARYQSYTDEQRRHVVTVKAKLVLIVFVYTLCWSPIAVCGLQLLLNEPQSLTPSGASWAAAVTVPLQPLLDVVAYRCFYVQLSDTAAVTKPSQGAKDVGDSEEAERAYISYRRTSVRRYSTFGDASVFFAVSSPSES